MTNEEVLREQVKAQQEKIAQLCQENKKLRDQVTRLEADVSYLQNEMDNQRWSLV